MIARTRVPRTRILGAAGALALSFCAVVAPSASAYEPVVPETSSEPGAASPAGFGTGVRDQVCKHLGIFCLDD